MHYQFSHLFKEYVVPTLCTTQYLSFLDKNLLSKHTFISTWLISVLIVYTRNDNLLKYLLSEEKGVLISYKLLTCDRTEEKTYDNISSKRALFCLYTNISPGLN